MSKSIDQQVAALLDRAIVIDGHCDILMPMSDGKMNVAERVKVPDPNTWQAPPGLVDEMAIRFGFNPHTLYFGCMGQYDIPRWREGGINTQLCAIFLEDKKLIAPFKHAMKMVRTFHQAIDANPELQLCLSAADIRQAKTQGKIGWVLTFEGCEALGGDVSMLDIFYRLGLRSVSLTHTRRNIFADGCWAADKQGGLTPLGKRLVQRLIDLKIVIDLVHIGEVGYWEILEMTNQPLILSHSTPTMFASTRPGDKDVFDGKVPRPRLEMPRDRDMLEALAKQGGVLGMIWILYRSLDEAVKDIETALEVLGPNFIGLGSDLFGPQFNTPGLEAISKLPNLLAALLKRGHSEEMLIKFLGQNYLRVFETVWGE